MTKSEYYNSVETEILSLREILSEHMNNGSYSERFQEFIKAGEYGLALEEITAALIEGGHSVPRTIFERIASLAKLMNIQEEHWKPVRVENSSNPIRSDPRT